MIEAALAQPDGIPPHIEQPPAGGGVRVTVAVAVWVTVVTREPEKVGDRDATGA